MRELPLLFDSVGVSIGATTLLSDLSLTLNAGAPTLVIGHNGAGKSTLLRLAMGLIAPTRGRVTWGGHQDPAPRRRAMVFQRPVMLRRSALQNVTYALEQAGVTKETIEARAFALLAQVGLQDLAHRPARRLSGGEQQRLALARALARDPELLILDEPTASLDPAATRAVEDIIAQAAVRGIKILMASHDLGQVRRLAGEVIFMSHGRLREVSAAQMFFENPKTPLAQAFLRGDIVLET
jgi:tungstate transport system ATP-binding protein